MNTWWSIIFLGIFSQSKKQYDDYPPKHKSPGPGTIDSWKRILGWTMAVHAHGHGIPWEMCQASIDVNVSQSHQLTWLYTKKRLLITARVHNRIFQVHSLSQEGEEDVTMKRYVWQGSIQSIFEGESTNLVRLWWVINEYSQHDLVAICHFHAFTVYILILWYIYVKCATLRRSVESNSWSKIHSHCHSWRAGRSGLGAQIGDIYIIKQVV